MSHCSELGRLQYIADHQGGRPSSPVLELVSVALEAGVPSVQVRCKGCSDRDRYELAKAVVALCRAAGACCIVNDRADIALATGAAGVHVGAEDLPIAEARRLLGPSALLGATVRAPAEALAAVRAGASYLGAGPCYPSTTKRGLPAPIGPEGIAAIARAVEMPVLAIGGVGLAQLPELFSAGAYGVAVVSAIASAGDPSVAAKELVKAAEALAETG